MKCIRVKKMMGVLTSIVFALALVVTPGVEFTALETQAVSYDMSTDFHCEPAWQVLDIVNQRRAEAGVASLQMDAALMATAKLRAEEIVQFFSHTRPDGTSCFTAFPSNQGSVGENIAAGQTSAAEVMGDWMNSPGHRANILDSDFSAIGIYCITVTGSYYGTYWVQCFGDNPENAILRGGAPTYPVCACDGSIPMYRLYNPNSGEHFYTSNYTETVNVCAAGWNYEGVAWYAPASGDEVYRLYNVNAGDHHYTMNAAERDHLISVGWQYEGVSWCSGGSTPLYRAYNPNAVAGAHHYSTNGGEIGTICAAGWNDEGIGWYGVR